MACRKAILRQVAILWACYWIIRGHDSLKLIFEIKVGAGQFTDDQIVQLLKALAAKEGLTCSEIVAAYAKCRTKIANNLLTVRKDFPT
ncbi:MAG TPA: hypothetical protein VOA41_18300 [Candidatus Dormibacteraeota bacterium]|nr:hypothetical protein [Candidatus Dormibacteraeota bacterium]